MVDKVKPLKFEDTTSGTEFDVIPTEADPDEDYVSAKGFAFENLDDYLIEKVGTVIKDKCPTFSEKATYSGDSISAYEVYETTTQTTINRRVRTDVTYSTGLISTEVIKIYDPSDGTTVLRTITISYTYSGDNVTKVDVSEA
jgi:hypothetical protein